MFRYSDLVYTVAFKHLDAAALHRIAMAIPNGKYAIVPPPKIRQYLLNPNEPKSAVFLGLGYTLAHPTALQEDIRAFATRDGERLGRPNAYGTTYLVSGTLTGPNGKTAEIKTVWIVKSGESFPRFVTAYPED